MKRRTFVRKSAMTAFSITAFGAINWNGRSFEGDNETTTDILGPFYRPGAPLRSNLIPADSTGSIMNLTGTVFRKDGKTPMTDVLIEAWQCDEHEKYDNTSDDYRFRGAVRTDKNGQYKFKTIVPVPYKDGETWRPAHIHLRVSSADHQDLITQIYFKGDAHIEKDAAAASRQAINRILEIKKVSSSESEVKFDIIMGKNFPLDEASYRKITGLYKLKDGNAEFYKEDDLLFLKINGQLQEALTYKGNNTFEGGISYMRAKFEIMPNGNVKTIISIGDWDKADMTKTTDLEGVKFLKY